MPTDIITAVSLLIAVTAVLLTLWQNVLQRRALQAQVFLHMLDQFHSDGVYNGCISLYGLPTYDNYEKYAREESAETQFHIRKLAEFLNDTARLVRSGYLPRQKVWDLYFMVYRTAHRKLLPWWLQGERPGSYAQRYIAFEEMCSMVARISDKQTAAFDRKEYHLGYCSASLSLLNDIGHNSLAKFERDVNRERTNAGLQAARARDSTANYAWPLGELMTRLEETLGLEYVWV